MELGVRVISVELTEISPPESVSDAFMSVSNARVKKQEIIKDAEGYANAIIPKARGDAATLTSKAEAYSKEIITNIKTKSRKIVVGQPQPHQSLPKTAVKKKSEKARIAKSRKR